MVALKSVIAQNAKTCRLSRIDPALYMGRNHLVQGCSEDEPESYTGEVLQATNSFLKTLLNQPVRGTVKTTSRPTDSRGAD